MLVAVRATFEYDTSAQDFEHAKIKAYQPCKSDNFNKL